MSIAAERSRPLPGTGRLGVVSAFFGLYGLAGAYAMFRFAEEALVRGSPWHATPVNAWVALGGAGLLTFGYLRTYWLLGRRRRSGAFLAALCLGGSVAASLFMEWRGWWAFGLPLVGLALLASVWRHLTPGTHLERRRAVH